MITQSELKALIEYRPDTGEFLWMVNRRGGRGQCRKGAPAGYADKKGYQYIRLNGREYLKHRLAFLYMTGSWPPDQVDHIDGKHGNNQWSNLRPCTPAENMQNITKTKRNTSGYIGVKRAQKRWMATIQVRGQVFKSRTYATPEEAYEAYLELKRQHHTFNPVPR